MPWFVPPLKLSTPDSVTASNVCHISTSVDNEIGSSAASTSGVGVVNGAATLDVAHKFNAYRARRCERGAGVPTIIFPYLAHI